MIIEKHRILGAFPFLRYFVAISLFSQLVRCHKYIIKATIHKHRIIGLTINIEENSVEGFKIYPNPVSEILRLSKETNWELLILLRV